MGALTGRVISGGTGRELVLGTKEASELTRTLELFETRRKEGEFATSEEGRIASGDCSDVVRAREDRRRNVDVGVINVALLGTTSLVALISLRLLVLLWSSSCVVDGVSEVPCLWFDGCSSIEGSVIAAGVSVPFSCIADATTVGSVASFFCFTSGVEPLRVETDESRACTCTFSGIFGCICGSNRCGRTESGTG